VWTVTIDCPTHDKGARTFRYQFNANVDNEILRRWHGAEDAAGSLAIEGPLQPNGTAELEARGRTVEPDYAVAHPTKGTPCSYRINARYEGCGSRSSVKPHHQRRDSIRTTARHEVRSCAPGPNGSCPRRRFLSTIFAISAHPGQVASRYAHFQCVCLSRLSLP